MNQRKYIIHYHSTSTNMADKFNRIHSGVQCRPFLYPFGKKQPKWNIWVQWFSCENGMQLLSSILVFPSDSFPILLIYSVTFLTCCFLHLYIPLFWFCSSLTLPLLHPNPVVGSFWKRTQPKEISECNSSAVRTEWYSVVRYLFDLLLVYTSMWHFCDV